VNVNLVVRRKKKKRKTENEVGKQSGKRDEAEESNTQRCSKLVNIKKRNREPVNLCNNEKLLQIEF
jgi:hypothetical protein